MGTQEHRKESKKQLKVAIVSVSTTRTLDTDESGAWIEKQAQKEGHEMVSRRVVPDEEGEIRKAIRDIARDHDADGIIVTGGTGITAGDVTIEAVRPMFRKELAAFGPIFAQLSFDEIDSAAILSRATAGIVSDSVVFVIPGSLAACKLACKNLIFPELGHVSKHARG
ncbi:molybdenum cofactor biosynthesis protein B [Desulfoluna sp.]|uniref:MogA/MoaB family molybdenum cofactor biosynthesis protein n=1 Tax=Desulfoluna sp. TaxID=2045199 RepID=UPI00263565A6|nr:molybdenum cofactor biosynthesis protein B [Desulfoluna sp.]